MLKGFKDFLLRGNVIDLAVAVVIGAAFTSVVTAFTDAFLKPLIQLFSGGGEFAGKIVVNSVEFDYASFINSTITFVITAAVVYFLVVYPMKWLQERRRRGEEDGPVESTDVELLTEIRDLLRAQVEGSATDSGTTDHAAEPTAQMSAAREPDRSGSTDGHRRPGGYDRAGYDRAGYDRAGYDRAAYDRTGYDGAGHDRAEDATRRPRLPLRPRSRHSADSANSTRR